MTEKTKGRELVPAELIIPAKPVLDCEWVTRRLRGEWGRSQAAQSIDVCGLETSPTSVADAERLSRAVLRKLDHAVYAGDRTEIAKMLRDRPELIFVANVRDKLSRWVLNGSLRAPRGRPSGATTWSPLVVASLVEHLVSSGAIRSREQAFSRLGVLASWA